MTAPTVVGVNATVETTNATSHAFTFDAAPSAGQKLLCIIACDGGSETLAIDTGASGSNWTAGTQHDWTGNSSTQYYYKTAEGSDALTITSGSQMAAKIAYRLSSDADFTAILSAWNDAGNSATPDPPNLTGMDSGKDYLVIAGGVLSDDDPEFSTAPSGYGTLRQANSTSTQCPTLATAEKAVTGATSENPGTFTQSGAPTSFQWQTFTIGIPAGAAAATITSITGSASGTVRADANCTIAGSGFESSQGSGVVEWQDVGGTWEDAQSYTSWSDTQIVCKAPTRSVGIKIGTGVSFRVTPTTNTADTDTCTFIPESGYTYETLSTTTLPAGSLANGVSGIAVGDVVIAETSWARSGGGDPATWAFAGSGDGTGSLTGYTADGDFSGDVDIQDATDGALTSNGPQTVTIDTTAPAGYTVSIDQDPITELNDTAVSFTFAGAEVGATYNYEFSDGEGAPVTGSGTVATATDQIADIDVSSLANGGITLTVYLTDTVGNVGVSVEDTSTKSSGSGAASITGVALISALQPALLNALAEAI